MAKPEPPKQKRILISGGGGFIGSHLARTLLEQGNFVRVVDIKFEDYTTRPFASEIWKRDLRDYQACVDVTDSMDEVYHLAANMGGIGFITEVGADIMWDNALMNVLMTRAMGKTRHPGKFLFTSSACIYPNYLQMNGSSSPNLKEDDAYPADPNEPYGWEKLFTEILVQSCIKDYELDARIARLHNVYGPEGTYKGGREKAPAALCRKVAEADDGDWIEIWGDGTATRSFCYVDDCVRGLIALMASDWKDPLNIGSDRLVSVDELAGIVIRISGKKVKKLYKLDAPVGVQGRNADLTLVKKVLGWEPKVSLEDGLAKTYLWILKQVMKGD